MSGTLPDGFTVRLNRRVWRFADGRFLAGGSPWRLVRLSAEAARLLTTGEVSVVDATTRGLVERLLDLGLVDPVPGRLPDLPGATVTVVVPVLDRPEALDRLLNSIHDPQFEVVVVDDASEDGDAVAQVAHRHGARLVRLPVNVGPAEARNRGLREVRTEFVAFIDSDVVLDEPLTVLLRHFHDPALAAVAPRLCAWDDTAAGWLGRYERHRSALDMGAAPGLVRPRAPLSYVPGACLVARVEALGPGFDARLRVAEDVDLVWRLAKSGWRVRYEPAVTVRHEHRLDFRGWFGRRFFYGTGAELLSRRHGADVAPAVLAPWSVAFLAGVLLQRRWSVLLGMMSVVSGGVRIASRLPRSACRYRVACALTGSAVHGSLRQVGGLMLRHWWPLSLLGVVVSRRARRALLVAVLVDGLLVTRSCRAWFDPAFLLARRLDDVAYGAGLWWGAIRGRSFRALVPEFGLSRRQRTAAPRAKLPDRGGTPPGTEAGSGHRGDATSLT